MRTGVLEADELGAMNHFLAAAPHAQVTHTRLARAISLDDLADRPPVAHDGVLDTGGHRLRLVPTPHVPHNWESALWFDESTFTLLGGDLFTTLGDGPAVTGDDLVEASMVAEATFHYSSLTPAVGPTLRQLADLEPTVIACMHGSSFQGDGAGQLRRLADAYEAMVRSPARPAQPAT